MATPQTRLYLSEKDWYATRSTREAPAAFGKRAAPLVLTDEERDRFLGSLPTTDRVLPFCISSDQVDRYNSVFVQEGRDDSNFHGAWLWAHDHGSCMAVPNPPIAQEVGAPMLIKRGDRTYTVAAPSFAGSDEGYELAELIFRLASARKPNPYITDCSIGVIPTKEELRDPADLNSGLRYVEWERLETSLCPIGANTDAVQLREVARANHLDLGPMIRWAEQALSQVRDEPGMWVPKSKLEAVLAQLGVTRGLKVFLLGGDDFGAALREQAATREMPDPDGKVDPGPGDEEPPEEEVEEAVKVCSACGTINPAENRYCGNCGAELGDDAEPEEGEEERGPKDKPKIPRAAELPGEVRAALAFVQELRDGGILEVLAERGTKQAEPPAEPAPAPPAAPIHVDRDILKSAAAERFAPLAATLDRLGADLAHLSGRVS